jgi:uncharacterized membrane protein YkvA (DUF1232 family)
VRQPAQGRRAERDPDRRAATRARRARSLSRRLEHARAVAAFIPDCAVLVKRLLGDPRVPRRAKASLLLLLPYLASPIDLVPDFIPVVGQLDDALLVAAALAYVVRLTGREVVRELWPGGGDGLRVVLALAR